MLIKKKALLFFVLLITKSLIGQVNYGSYGDPIAKITFGSGPNPGPPISGVSKRYLYTRDACPLDRFYTLSNQTQDCWASWHHLNSDHTGDKGGYFLLVDGSLDPGDFFLDTIKGLCRNTDFELSAWIMNVNQPYACNRNSVLPNITFSIQENEGTVLKQYNTGNISVTTNPEWKEYRFFFTKPPGLSNIIIRMSNEASGSCGNDFAIDDITLRPYVSQLITFFNEEPSVSVKELSEGESADVTFSCNIPAGYTNTTISWQESTDRGKTWTNIAGANSTEYIKRFPGSTPLGNYLFRSILADAMNLNSFSCSVISNVLTARIIKKLYIPNAFTPNGDGINDTWIIQAIRALSGFNLCVYDRDGRTVFQTNDYNKHWDGSYNGHPLPFGTYYYILDFKDGLPNQKGYVTIIR